MPAITLIGCVKAAPLPTPDRPSAPAFLREACSFATAALRFASSSRRLVPFALVRPRNMLPPDATPQSIAPPVPRRLGFAPRRVGIVVSLALGWFAFSACDLPPRPILRNNADGSANGESLPAAAPLEIAAELDAAAEAGTRHRYTQPWETWQALYKGGKHVGFSHVRVEPADETPDSNIRITMVDQIALRRGAAVIQQRFEQTTIETRQGELVSFDAELRVGPALTRYSGKLVNRSLMLEMTRSATVTPGAIPWQSHYWGPIGLQQAMLAKPIALGEQRQLSLLMPIRFEVASAQLNCQHRASIAMPDGDVRDALEVDIQMTPPGDSAPLQSVIWIDEQGNVIKTFSPATDLVAFTTTREAATDQVVPTDRLLTATAVRVEGQIDEPARANQTLFEITPRGKIPAADQPPAIPPQPGQWVRKLDSGTYQLFVSDRKPASQASFFETAKPTPSESDLSPGKLVNSNDTLVAQLSQTAAIRLSNQRDLAVDLAVGVHALIVAKETVEGWIPASDVAAEQAGDCKGRAVLLAAMLRARKIPARVAVGLVYVPSQPQPRMVFHAWTLAYIEGEWVQLDPNRPNGLAAADRILLGSSDLADGEEFELLASVVNFMSRFNVRIVRSAIASEE